MKSKFYRGRLLPRAGQVAFVILVTCLSSYCTSPDKQTEINPLTDDEAYLVDAYVRVAKARELASVTPLKSDSFFAPLDSTVDTTRIANTIRALEKDPDRWILIFQSIEHDMNPEGARPGAEVSGNGTPVSQ